MIAEIQMRDPIRAAIAAQTAEFEARYGQVQTLPIRIGNAPIETFSINSPGKPKPEKQSIALRQADHQRVTMRTQKKMEKVQKIRELAATGMKIADIAEQAGLTAKYVMKIINEYGFARGPQTILEG